MSPRTRALMLQGTASHVGKTVLVAALCRIFRDAGWRVAPFKAQNMALNAYVTPEGGEIGWAQALQAEAAGVPPRVDMNPILLKPEPGGAQVIVHGRVRATFSPTAYCARRAELWPEAVAAYRRLAAGFDLVVIEGAGSPAEPNLMATVREALLGELGVPGARVGPGDYRAVRETEYARLAAVVAAHVDVAALLGLAERGSALARRAGRGGVRERA